MRERRLLLLAAVVVGTGCGQGRLGEAELAARRARCAFTANTPAADTVPEGAPLGSEMPIDTIVIVMMENRSFDHLLAELPAAGQGDAEVADASHSNRDSRGVEVPFHPAGELCFRDPDHEWEGSHLQWNEGRNDGFVITNENGVPADGARAMTWYGAADLPFLYGLATTFAIADHFHASLLGPTFPNRNYLYAGSSFGLTGGTFPAGPITSLMTRLDEAKIDWFDYYTANSAPGVNTLGTSSAQHVDVLSSFFIDAADGVLAPLVFVDPDLVGRNGAAKDDFHPPGDVQLGDQFLDRVIRALLASPQWPRMAIFVTFDEHGGLYDHVPPPAACPPDDLLPDKPGGKFDRLGFRVPLIAISPYARPHFVSHRTYDLTSITRFVESRFLLKALSARDANADPLYELFDFATPRFATPPTLPSATVDMGKLAECLVRFPRG